MQSLDDARPASLSGRARWWFAAVRPDNLIVYLGFLAVVVFFAIILQDRGFLTGDNFANIARQTAMVSIMAFGMTFVLSAGEIDLSIGSIVALCAMVVAILLRETNLVIAVLGALAVGLAVGLVNGLLTTRLRIPSFLVTLGHAQHRGRPCPHHHGSRAGAGRRRDVRLPLRVRVHRPIPILLVWTAVFLVVFHIVLRRTPFGRQVLATGGNRIAAGYSGINTDRIKIAVLMMSAGTAAVAGMLYAGRLQGARYTLGEADLLTVIAATVIGGTSMFGGKGSIVGALVGSLLMGVLNNGLLLMGLTVSEQLVARGIIIIAAVALSLREART